MRPTEEGGGRDRPGGHPPDEALEAFLDGELPSAEGERLRRHLAECSRCGDLLADLEELRTRAGALPRDVEPARDLWPGIQARIRARAPGGTLRVLRVEKRPRGAWIGFAVAAGLAGVIAGGFLLSGGPDRIAESPGPGEAPGTARFASEVREVEEAYRPALDELRLLAESRDLAPETLEVLEESLDVIERAIREAREAVEADPSGARALERLRRMYDAKVEVLRTVAEHHSRT